MAIHVLDSAEVVDDNLCELAPVISRRLDAIAHLPGALWDKDLTFVERAWRQRHEELGPTDGREDDADFMRRLGFVTNEMIQCKNAVWNYLDQWVVRQMLSSFMMPMARECWHLVAAVRAPASQLRPAPRLVQLKGHTFFVVRNVRVMATGCETSQWRASTLVHLRRSSSSSSSVPLYATRPVETGQIGPQAPPPSVELEVGNDWALIAARGPTFRTTDEHFQVELRPGGVVFARHLSYPPNPGRVPDDQLVLHHVSAGKSLQPPEGADKGTIDMTVFHELHRLWGVRLKLTGPYDPHGLMQAERYGDSEQRQRDHLDRFAFDHLHDVEQSVAPPRPQLPFSPIEPPPPWASVTEGRAANDAFLFQHDSAGIQWRALFRGPADRRLAHPILVQFFPCRRGFLLWMGLQYHAYLLEPFPWLSFGGRPEHAPPLGWRVADITFGREGNAEEARILRGMVEGAIGWANALFRLYGADVGRWSQTLLLPSASFTPL